MPDENEVSAISRILTAGVEGMNNPSEAAQLIAALRAAPSSEDAYAQTLQAGYNIFVEGSRELMGSVIRQYGPSSTAVLNKLQMNIGGNSYMSDMTIRDPDAMVRFANEIDGYCDAMQRVCKNLQSNLSSASPMMKDEKSKRALQKIEVLASELISGLPEAKGAAEKLRAAAKPLKEAQSISF